MATKKVKMEKPSLKETEAAEFSNNTLESVKNSADSVTLIKGAVYVCTVNQKFHAETNLRGTKSNRVFVFEMTEDSNRLMSMPFSYLNNIFIMFEKDLKPVQVETRETESGEVYHRPLVSYIPATKGGNITDTFKVDGSDMLTGVFALKCVDIQPTVSARYETSTQMKNNGHTVRELLMEEDGTARLQIRNTYLFERVDVKEYLESLPSSKEAIEKMFTDLGMGDDYKTKVEPWLL
jgi:hypothetical protein